MTEVLSSTVPPLYLHQQQAIDHILNRNGSGALFLDPGLGKTRTALEIFKLQRQKNPNLKLLVVAPLSLLEAAWRADAEKFFPGEWKFANMHKRENWAASDIIAVNYEFFQKETSVIAFMGIIRHIDIMVVLDESSRLKNHKTLTTKHFLAIRNAFKYRIVMSGTPAPNDESEYWAQLEFVCPGILGKSFPKFQRTFFYLRSRSGAPINMDFVPTRQVMQDLFSKQGAEWAITQKSREALFKVIGPWIHAAKKEECLDLPPQIDEVRLVQMGPKQKVAYNHMKRNLIAEIEGQDVVAQVALTKLMKLREITSGFAFSENQEIVETECPKLVELEEILDELGDRQAIIWGNFTWEIQKIRAMLASRGAGVATLFGGTLDKEGAIKAFISGQVRYLVANPHSAAHGLTFVNCSHQIFFSLDYSWEAYEQARARTHRAGQTSTCVYYYILADGTIDQEILNVLKKKGDAQDLVFKFKEQLKGEENIEMKNRAISDALRIFGI